MLAASRESAIPSSRVAIVTGGGTGIGRGIALALARRGVSVALVGRRRKPLEESVAQIIHLGGKALAIPADITVPSACQEVVARTRNQFGPIDILINNAGLLAAGALNERTGDEITTAITTNLVAPIELTRLTLPDLIAQRGSVVLIGSTTSWVPLPYMSLYSTTKAGLRAFGEALRYELSPQGVHLLMAFPPATATSMVEGMRQTAGSNAFRLADPDTIGEDIVCALETRRRECIWWSSEHLLRILYQIAPRAVALMLRMGRQRFAKITHSREA